MEKIWHRRKRSVKKKRKTCHLYIWYYNTSILYLGMKYLENPSRKFSGKIFFFSPLRKVNFVFIKCFSYFPTTKNMYIADIVNQFSFFWFKVCRNYTFLLPNLWCKVMCGILINPALFLRFNAWVKWFLDIWLMTKICLHYIRAWFTMARPTLNLSGGQ